MDKNGVKRDKYMKWKAGVITKEAYYKYFRRRESDLISLCCLLNNPQVSCLVCKAPQNGTPVLRITLILMSGFIKTFSKALMKTPENSG